MSTFADARKREEIALDFWYACEAAALREKKWPSPCASYCQEARVIVNFIRAYAD